MSLTKPFFKELSEDNWRCQINNPQAISLAPLAAIALLAGLLSLSATSEFAQWLLDENRPVELLTFAFALLAAVKSFKFAQKQAKKNVPIALFYLLFALLFFFFAMEEIAWGQQFLQFNTPEFWRIRNAQDELTLHNYDHPSVRYLETYPLLAGLIGLIGIWANLTRRLPKRICPPLILGTWFATIALHSGLDLFHEFHIFSPSLDDLINHLDEAAEMLVALSGLLYIHYNSRRLSP